MTTDARQTPPPAGDVAVAMKTFADRLFAHPAQHLPVGSAATGSVVDPPAGVVSRQPGGVVDRAEEPHLVGPAARPAPGVVRAASVVRAESGAVGAAARARSLAASQTTTSTPTAAAAARAQATAPSEASGPVPGHSHAARSGR